MLGQERRLAAGDLPDLRGAVNASADHVEAFLVEGDRGNPVAMAAEGLHFLAGVAFDLPELDKLVGGSGREMLIVLAKSDARHGAGMAGQDHAVFAGGRE